MSALRQLRFAVVVPAAGLLRTGDGDDANAAGAQSLGVGQKLRAAIGAGEEDLGRAHEPGLLIQHGG